MHHPSFLVRAPRFLPSPPRVLLLLLALRPDRAQRGCGQRYVLRQGHHSVRQWHEVGSRDGGFQRSREPRGCARGGKRSKHISARRTCVKISVFTILGFTVVLHAWHAVYALCAYTCRPYDTKARNPKDGARSISTLCSSSSSKTLQHSCRVIKLTSCSQSCSE